MDIDLFYIRVAYASLLFIFVFCGVLRSLDFWKTLGKDADELYPARRTVSCIYFSVVVLLPCALHPQSVDARLLARCFWVLFVPAATSLCYKRFFFGDARYKWLRIALVGGVPLVAVLILSCISLSGGDVLLPHKKAVIHVVGVLGALLTAYGIHVMIWLLHITSGADATARAADRLFPKRFASGMLWVSSLVLTVTWAIFLFGGMLANTVFTGLIALLGLGILFVILHPQRVEEQVGDVKHKVMVAVTPDGGTLHVAVPFGEHPDKDAMSHAKAFSTPATCMGKGGRTSVGTGNELTAGMPCRIEYEEDATTESARPKEKKYMLSDAQLDSLERQIRKFVEGKRQYLDPKLTRKTLEEKLCVNHFYLSEVFARRFGSLTLYLNTLRMEHAIRYAAEHPDAKQTEVAHNSGFGSDNSYYRAKRTYDAEKTSRKIKETDNPMDDRDLPK